MARANAAQNMTTNEATPSAEAKKTTKAKLKTGASAASLEPSYGGTITYGASDALKEAEKEIAKETTVDATNIPSALKPRASTPTVTDATDIPSAPAPITETATGTQKKEDVSAGSLLTTPPTTTGTATKTAESKGSILPWLIAGGAILTLGGYYFYTRK